MNDVQLTVFAEKTIEKSLISHLIRFTFDRDDVRAPLSTPGPGYFSPSAPPPLAGLEVNKETNKEPSVVGLNSDLEGLSYPIPTTGVHYVNSIRLHLRFAIIVHFCKAK